VAHKGSGGLGGLFDFEKGADFRTGGGETVGEEVGVGGDDAEKIVERVGDDLIFGESKGDGNAVGIVERKLHLRTFLKQISGLGIGKGGGDGTVKGVGGEFVESDAAGSAGGDGLLIEIGNGAGVESDDGEGRIFGANFFDVVETLEIPGVNVDDEGMPAANGKRMEKVGERFEAVKTKRSVRRREKSLRKF
jgi:hypothetical protein